LLGYVCVIDISFPYKGGVTCDS